jgi:hypothetical protein
MNDLGLTYYSLTIDYKQGAFVYTLHFSLLATNGLYSTRGTAATPQQCIDQATSYIAQVVREAVAE